MLSRDPASHLGVREGVRHLRSCRASQWLGARTKSIDHSGEQEPASDFFC
jgi:hypothetical protein